VKIIDIDEIDNATRGLVWGGGWITIKDEEDIQKMMPLSHMETYVTFSNISFFSSCFCISFFIFICYVNRDFSSNPLSSLVYFKSLTLGIISLSFDAESDI
jgi:hypothetical protein